MRRLSGAHLRSAPSGDDLPFTSHWDMVQMKAMLERKRQSLGVEGEFVPVNTPLSVTSKLVEQIQLLPF